MAYQTKYQDAIINVPETSFSRHQENHLKCNQMSNIAHKEKREKGKSVKFIQYQAVRLVFATI